MQDARETMMEGVSVTAVAVVSVTAVAVVSVTVMAVVSVTVMVGSDGDGRCERDGGGRCERDGGGHGGRPRRPATAQNGQKGYLVPWEFVGKRSRNHSNRNENFSRFRKLKIGDIP